VFLESIFCNNSKSNKEKNAMKAKMKKLISIKSIPILALALLAGVVLMTGIAWAKSTEYSVNCEFTYGGTSMAKMWTDDEGVEHLRGIVYLLNSDPNSGNIIINIAGVCNHNREMVVTGDGDFWGHDHAAVTWGDLTGTFQGIHAGIRVNFTEGSSIHVYKGIDGDLVGWTLRLNGIWNMDPDVKAGSFTGTLHNPYGE
jgi:hypothetical protein